METRHANPAKSPTATRSRDKGFRVPRGSAKNFVLFAPFVAKSSLALPSFADFAEFARGLFCVESAPVYSTGTMRSRMNLISTSAPSTVFTVKAEFLACSPLFSSISISYQSPLSDSAPSMTSLPFIGRLPVI